MTEFLSEYGMFLAKSVTLVLAVLFLVGGIIATAARNRHAPDDGTLRVKNTNEEIRALREGLTDEILPAAQRKKVHKERKKEQKQKDKQAKTAEPDKRAKVFVLDFNGDLQASAVSNMRNEISAVLQVAEQDDEVVVRLESPGGLVHGYGLAASQLKRVRDKGIALTICVDQVAASGGYMMACIGSRLMAAPFAVIGSIGVVAQIPNFHRLLKKNNVDVELMTAGEYKRTLTIFGENTDKMREKFQEELDDTHLLFKDFVRENRPSLDLDKVATGEHWFGMRALELGLVDELKTSDEYLVERSESADVFEVRWEEKRKLMDRLGFAAEGAISRSLSSVLQRATSRWMH